MTKDLWEENTLEAPARHAFAITAHDVNELAIYTRAIYVGAAGNLKVKTVSGVDVTFVDVPAGSIIPIRAKVVFHTGTVATSLVALC